MKKLCWTQRNAIAKGIREGKSNAQIAREIGVHRSTVGREIERNALCREKYCPRQADDLSWQRQQEAVPKRGMLFGGVKFGAKLKRRNVIYTYHSFTHLNKICRYLENYGNWNPAYLRMREKNRYTPEWVFLHQRWFKARNSSQADRNFGGQKSEPSVHYNRKVEKSEERFLDLILIEKICSVVVSNKDHAARNVKITEQIHFKKKFWDLNFLNFPAFGKNFKAVV
jgi:hypothetical protein